CSWNTGGLRQRGWGPAVRTIGLVLYANHVSWKSIRDCTVSIPRRGMARSVGCMPWVSWSSGAAGHSGVGTVGRAYQSLRALADDRWRRGRKLSCYRTHLYEFGSPATDDRKDGLGEIRRDRAHSSKAAAARQLLRVDHRKWNHLSMV